MEKFLRGLKLTVTLAVVFAAASHARAQGPAALGNAAAAEQARQLINTGWAEIMKYERPGGPPRGAAHPGKKWADKLWRFRAAHPNTKAGAGAARAALEMLVAADRAAEALALTRSVPTSDPAWGQAIYGLLRAHRKLGSLEAFFPRAEAILSGVAGKEGRAHVLTALAQAYLDVKDYGRAKSSYLAVSKELPGSTLSRQAEGHIFEMENLRPGQAAPAFSGKLTDGTPLSLAALKGRPVLLQFYASWCGICMAELPRVKAVHEKYKDEGLVLIGVSLDDDRAAFERMVAEKGVTWPQVMDGLAFKGDIPKLFNIQTSAVFYLLDQEGRISAKGRIAETLDDEVAKLLN